MNILLKIKSKIAKFRRRKYQHILDEIDMRIEGLKVFREINNRMIKMVREHNYQKSQWHDKMMNRLKGFEG